MGSMPSELSGPARRERLLTAHLYLVIEGTVGGRSALPVVEAALEGGVDIVQLRDKTGSDASVLAAAAELSAACAAHGALFIVNDRPDLAVAAAADGVHVGQDDVAVAEARGVVGPDLLIGLSTHSPAQVDAAGAEPLDYTGVGPVFATTTKPTYEPVGLELVRYAARRARAPFFAIGGIDLERVARVRDAGAQRIAIVRAVRDAADPRAAAAALRSAVAGDARSAAGL
jgi:thiamine-phosphate pyrophosphorylase